MADIHCTSKMLKSKAFLFLNQRINLIHPWNKLSIKQPINAYAFTYVQKQISSHLYFIYISFIFFRYLYLSCYIQVTYSRREKRIKSELFHQKIIAKACNKYQETRYCVYFPNKNTYFELRVVCILKILQILTEKLTFDTIFESFELWKTFV